eukprot:3266854-Rhodomonas_salina.1
MRSDIAIRYESTKHRVAGAEGGRRAYQGVRRPGASVSTIRYLSTARDRAPYPISVPDIAYHARRRIAKSVPHITQVGGYVSIAHHRTCAEVGGINQYRTWGRMIRISVP